MERTRWIETARAELARQGLAGWLLYDFRGSNPLAAPFLAFEGAFLTRRVFAFVPREGEPTLLVSAIEAGSLRAAPFRVRTYADAASLDALLRELRPAGPVAMEVSPGGDLPYVSTVDAGTTSKLEGLGWEIVSSAELLQAFAAWTPEQQAQHRRAAAAVMETLDLAWTFLHARTGQGLEVRESDVQRVISEAFAARGLVEDHPSIIGFGPHSGDPHYAPRPGADRELRPGDPILIDLFAREDVPGAPFGDVTWMGVYGEPSPRLLEAFDAVVAARDLGVRVLHDAFAEGRRPQGREVDRAVRDLLTERGYGDAFWHRTGHSLGTRHTHGEAAHLDDFETRDTRTLRPGLGVTIEPGVYGPEFGVRSELNVLLGEDGPEVTTGEQRELVRVELGPHHRGREG